MKAHKLLALFFGLALLVVMLNGPGCASIDGAAKNPLAPSTAVQQTMFFQQGVSPSLSYSGTTDVILANDADDNANLGGTENLEVYREDVERRRSLLRWDISALPADITVDAATVELYRYEVGENPNDMQVALYRVSREWAEGTGYELEPGSGYVPDGATWLTATTGAAWTTPGGDYDATVIDQVTLLAGMTNGWVRLDATAAVQDWVETGAPNYGLLLISQSGDYTYHYFHSRNAITTTLRPRLVVTYTQGGMPPAHWVYLPIALRNHATQPPSCENPLTGVSISGPTGGYTHVLYTFTAGLTPSNATTPVTFDWSPPPASGQGTTSASYQWDMPDDYTIGVLASNCGGTHQVSDTHTITVGTPPTSTGDLDVSLTLSNPLAVAREDEPVTSGVPVPRDLNLTDLSALRLLDGTGQPVPAQFTPLARWGGAPDDDNQPVRWLLLDFQADVSTGGTASYRLVDSGGATPAYPSLSVTDGANTVTVNTGAAQFSISKTDGRLSGPNLSSPVFGRATAGGTEYTTTGPVDVTIEMEGAMRVSVHVKGSYRDAGGVALVDYISRYWFYAGQPTVRLFHTLENNTPCPLDGSGQISCHDIGSAGSVDVSDVSWVLLTDLGGGLSYQAAGEGAPVSGSLTDDLLLYQDSSGTDGWNTYPTFSDWEGNPLDTSPRMQTYVSFRGYRTTLGAAVVDSGDQAVGWLSLSGNDGTWTVGVRDFWQNFPKALRAAPDGTLEIGLFPDEFGAAQGYDFNLRAGEHKTHEVWLSTLPSLPLSPLFAQASPQWYVDSQALGPTTLPNWTDWPDHEQYLVYQLDTSPEHGGFDHYFDNLFDAIQSTDFYGIFDYGDWPIDYEGYKVAPLNPKYNADYGMWLQWARGADERWFGLAEAANRHFADIDVLHTLHSPRHWSDGIIFGHSAHDEAGFTNPHRNSNSGHPDTAYGLNGMLLTFYLTGYEKAYESALELANCIEYRLHNDQHLCDYFPGDCNGQGEGLEGSSDGLYENGCRPAANALFIAVNAYRATADPRYLAVADAVVQWADPDDQPYIDGPTGQDQRVKPGMLNQYLRSLAEYLEVRSEFGLPDDYDAAGDLLAYVDWLHTYPWIELTPIETGPRAAYPYEWWFDERSQNDEPDVGNWTLTGADAMAYAYQLSGVADYLNWATYLFRTGSRDPFYEDDASIYSETKQTVNSISFGHLFLFEWIQSLGR